MISQLVKWANHYCYGKIMLVLEGGYDLSAAKVCTQAVVSALFEEKWFDPLGRSPFPETDLWKNIILKAMVQNLLLQRNEAVVMDMEAGIEHLGRATAQAVDQLVVVVEPGKRSIETAYRIKALADDIKLSKIAAHCKQNQRRRRQEGRD